MGSFPGLRLLALILIVQSRKMRDTVGFGWELKRYLFPGGGGLRLRELSLRDTEDEEKDAERDREREREPEAEDEEVYEEDRDADPEGVAGLGLPDLAMQKAPFSRLNWQTLQSISKCT